MENIVNSLYDSIKKAVEDNPSVSLNLSTINGSTICIGSGGSKVVACYAAKVLSQKHNVLCNFADPSSLRNVVNCYDNILVCSYSGSNYGVKYTLAFPKQCYLFSSRKTNIFKEELIHYSLDDENSFISLCATIVPMALLLKYYLGDKFDEVIDDIFKKIDKDITLSNVDRVNIFASSSSLTALTFLDSTLIEAGIGVPIIHYKYDYCHGRSTINKNHNNSAILFNDGLDIDNSLIEVIEITMKENVIISSPYSDEVISDFYYTLVSLYLMYNIAVKRKIDLKHIDYDRVAVKRLYYFKGSM